MMRVLSVLWLAGFVCGELCSAVSVAVYNPETDGGVSCGERGIFDALKKREDIEPELVTELSNKSLRRFDVLVVPDVFRVGQKGKGWAGCIEEF